MQELSTQFKYYKHETENPYARTDRNAAMWWEGERALNQKINANPEYVDTLEHLYDEAYVKKQLRGILANGNTPKEARLVIFFLDIWHGSRYPYDNRDEINKY